MTVISVTPGALGSAPTVECRVGAEVLEIALRGATPLRWLVDLPGGVVDVLDGYRDAAELEAQDGVRGGIMAPFCNRVFDARYEFDGAQLDLLPGASDRTIYHGLVREAPFVLVETDQMDDGVRLTFRCDALASGAHPGYPYQVEVHVTYWVRRAALTVEIAGHNIGPGAAPFVAGWHPYFRLPGAASVDRLELRSSATVAVQTDPDLIPRRGAAAYRPLADRLHWEPIGDAVVDACFGGLGADADEGAIAGPAGGVSAGDGRARTVLRDPVTGLRLGVWQDGGLVHLFTGDTVGRDRRRSIAIEPVAAMTDAFNRPDCAASIRLEPGDRRAFRFGVDISTDASTRIA